MTVYRHAFGNIHPTPGSRFLVHQFPFLKAQNMAAATKPKPKSNPKSKAESARVGRLTVELENAKNELAQVHGFLDQIQRFSDLVTTTKTEITALAEKEFELKEQLSEVRSNLRSLRSLVDSSNEGMLATIEPGPVEFMPLFDRMETSNPKTHGKNAGEWREHPIAVLRLSPVASTLLIDSGILFIGQLQDRILDSDEWWESVAKLEAPMAAAIADKLIEFAKKGGAA